MDRVPPPIDAARIERLEACQDAQQRGFARAVGTEERDLLAAPNRERGVRKERP